MEIPPDLRQLVETFEARYREAQPEADSSGSFVQRWEAQNAALKAIQAHEHGPQALRQLLQHPDRRLALSVAFFSRSVAAIREELLAVAESLKDSPEIGMRSEAGAIINTLDPNFEPGLAFQPLPKPYGQAEAARLIGSQIEPARAAQFSALLRPALRLWSQPVGRSTDHRFGGLPMVPSGWEWPWTVFDSYGSGELEEIETPMHFMAQIDCASVHALGGIGATLPRVGLLSFFASPEAIAYGQPCGECAVYHFEDLTVLREASPPPREDDFNIHPPCGLAVFETWELPDFDSDLVKRLGLSDDEREVYARLNCALMLREFPPTFGGDEVSKLFGWPNTIQNDFENMSDVKTDGLLLQVGVYRTGADTVGWGPGGFAYFGLSAEDVAARRWDRTALGFDCT